MTDVGPRIRIRQLTTMQWCGMECQSWLASSWTAEAKPCNGRKGIQQFRTHHPDTTPTDLHGRTHSVMVGLKKGIIEL